MLELSVLAIVFSMTLGGYVFYGKNIFKEEISEFYILPWVTFSFLALLDLINILTSEDMAWFEAFAGTLMFLGPLGVSILILRNGLKLHGYKQEKFFYKKILNEYSQSKAEAILLLIGMSILLGLLLVDRYTSWGGSYEVELAFAIATIALDVIAALALTSEVREMPRKFERVSWSIWAFAALLAYGWNIYTGAHAAAIGSLLILESSLISIWMLGVISHYRR